MSSSHTKLLVCCLLLFATTLICAAGVGNDVMRLIGAWELVGLGDATGNIARPQKVLISFFVSGQCKLRVWEEDGAQPDKVGCRFSVSEDVLKWTFGASETTESCHIAWDGWHLVLDPIDTSSRRPVPLRFEKRRAWVLP